MAKIIRTRKEKDTKLIPENALKTAIHAHRHAKGSKAKMYTNKNAAKSM